MMVFKDVMDVPVVEVSASIHRNGIHIYLNFYI